MEEIFSEFRSGKRTTGTWLSKSVLWQLRKFPSSSFEEHIPVYWGSSCFLKDCGIQSCFGSLETHLMFQIEFLIESWHGHVTAISNKIQNIYITPKSSLVFLCSQFHSLSSHLPVISGNHLPVATIRFFFTRVLYKYSI